MQADVLSLYQTIAQAMADTVPEEWEKVCSFIGCQDKVVSNAGIVRYTTQASNLLIRFSNLDDERDDEVVDAVRELHAITTAGGNNRWNYLWFALSPSGAYEIEFVYNEAKVEYLDQIAETREMPEARRGPLLTAFQQAQAARDSPPVYDKLVREVVRLIPEQWAAASVSLREVGLGCLEHHAHYRGPHATQDDDFNITYGWPVLLTIEQLIHLKEEGGHPDWEQVTFAIEASGTYRATFTGKAPSESGPAAGFFHEGRWQEPGAAAAAA